MTGTRGARRNLLNRGTETFRVPVFKPNSTALGRLENRARRFLDLQAASIWRDLAADLPETSGAVLDVGAGAQVYKDLLGSGTQYQAIDTRAAKEHFGYEVPGTLYYEGDVLPIADSSVDCVLCTEVLEHVPDSATFLRELCRCLRPQGRLLLTVPFAARWHFIPHDYWRFTPSGLARLLTQAGFTDIEVRARGNPLTVACYKAMALPLMLLTTETPSLVGKIAARISGLVLSPFLALAGCVGNLSLSSDWGDDCLGYTVRARRR